MKLNIYIQATEKKDQINAVRNILVLRKLLRCLSITFKINKEHLVQNQETVLGSGYLLNQFLARHICKIDRFVSVSGRNVTQKYRIFWKIYFRNGV